MHGEEEEGGYVRMRWVYADQNFRISVDLKTGETLVVLKLPNGEELEMLLSDFQRLCRKYHSW